MLLRLSRTWRTSSERQAGFAEVTEPVMVAQPVVNGARRSVPGSKEYQRQET
jgi:hypothetical protein